MEFLAPLYLLALAAAAIPLWLHLRRLRTERRVIFPAIRYLQRARQAYAQRLQLRHWLLLATRLALVVAAALAAAATLLGRGDARDHPPTRVALVLDNSISTALVRGDRPVFEVLRAGALTSVRWSNAEDRFWIVPATRPEDALGPLSPREAATELEAMRPVPVRADLTQAASRAASLVSGRGGPAEVHLLSDLQATNLGDEPGPAATPVAIFAPEDGPVPNLAVTDVRAVQSPVAAGEAPVLVAEVERFGEGERSEEEVTVRAVADDRVVGLATARPGAAVTIVLPPAGGGSISGYVEIDPSGLRADDRRYFSVPVRPTTRVALVGGVGPFAEASIAALETGARARLVSNPTAADVVWARGGEGIGEALRQGRRVVIVPDEDPLALPRLNARLARAGIPWRFAYDDTPGIGRLGEGAEWIPGARGQTVRQSYRLDPEGPRTGRTWVRLESGEPWLVASDDAFGGTAVLVGSPLTERGTDLVAAAAMVPFVDALVNGWPAERGEIPGADGHPGVPLPPRATALEFPSRRRRAVEGGARLRAVDEAGVYRVWAADSVVRRFVVNPPAVESDLTRATEADITRRWPAARLALGGSEADWRGAIYAARRGREASLLLLSLLLLLALLELRIASSDGRGPVRRAQAGATP